MDLKQLSLLPLPHQSYYEWRPFLEFSSAYLLNRGVTSPVVVEVGTYQNKQRPFYEQLLNARHIGIDIIDTNSAPDIVGDSHSQETVDRLKEKLAGQPADMVFIDGEHSYASVKKDWELYGPMARYLVAFHDICTPDAGVKDLWKEIREKEPVAEFKSKSTYMGIGVVLK